MEKPKDYYQLLGVPRDASVTAIKRAFRRLARGLEPHLATGAVASGLAELQAAYETLTDAERRRRYDDTLRNDRPSPPDWALVRHPAAGDLRRPFAPTSLVAEVVLSSDDAARGAVLPLDVPVTSTCDSCQGTGGSLFDCDRCSGEGKIVRRLPVPVHVPSGTREGAVFEVRTGDPAVPCVLIAVHVRRAR
jgi:DnaJ-class molecular chaperone